MRELQNLLLGASFILLCGAAALASDFSKKVSTECGRINAVILEQISQGQIDDAKGSLAEALTHDISRLEPVCAGLLSNNVAAGLQMWGRLDQARTFAEQAINYYQKSLPADDPICLGPLEILATTDLEKGITGRAREVIRRMQMIHATDPQGRMVLLYVNGCLLKREGRGQEAESQLTGALSALADAGKQNSGDGGAILGELANLYLQEHRYRKAAAALTTALATPSLSGNAAILVRINLLNTRAVVWGRQNRWRDAGADLAEAVALCRQQSRMDSAELEPILTNYAYVLRKMHRKPERSVEAWAAAVRRENRTSRQVIDITDLAANGSAHR